jgi:hypothetical protein
MSCFVICTGFIYTTASTMIITITSVPSSITLELQTMLTREITTPTLFLAIPWKVVLVKSKD